MSFDEFIAKWNGKGLDFDGVYGDQCMDLMHQYCVEVLGLTDGRILAAPSAKDVWLSDVFGKERFEAIANTPTGVPQKGDIMLWGTGIGQYGHVAIFESGDANSFKSFDQNWNGHTYCETITHSYNAVTGWLRFKTTSEPMATISQKEVDQIRHDRDQHYNDLVAAKQVIDNLNQQINDRNNDIVQLNSQGSTLTSQVTDLETQRDSALEQAKRVPELKELLNQAMNDRQVCLNAQEGMSKSVAQKERRYLELIASPPKHFLAYIVRKITRQKESGGW